MNSPEQPTPEFVTVAKVGEIPEGSGMAFDVAGQPVAVFLVDGQYYAIDDRCPHMGASLAIGELVENQVACPLHEWRFDIRTGTWCDDRRIKIDRFKVRIEDDEIQICPVSEPQ